MCSVCEGKVPGGIGPINLPDVYTLPSGNITVLKSNENIETIWLDGARYWDRSKAYEIKISQAKSLLNNWVNKQGHDRCWYYPEIFQKLCELFGVEMTVEPKLPPPEEFTKGCERYRNEEYAKDTELYGSMIQRINIPADFNKRGIDELGKRNSYFRYVEFPVEVIKNELDDSMLNQPTNSGQLEEIHKWTIEQVNRVAYEEMWKAINIEENVDGY